MIKLNNQKILSALATSLFLVSFSPTIAEDYNETKTAQTTLKNLGYSVGSVDGILGAKTLDAITKFCQTEKPKCNPNNIEEVLALLNKPSEITQKPKKRSRLGSITIFPNQNKIPDSFPHQPNDATIAYYIRYQRGWYLSQPKYEVMPARSPLKFERSLETNKIIDQQLSDTTLLSYLFFDDGVIVYDAVVNKKRFDITIDEKTYFPSHSMGKSITSYLIGHAVCQGYIKSIDEPIHDWELMKDTLYYGQPLVNLLNMKAGDSNIVEEKGGNFRVSGRSIHDRPLILAAKNPSELKNTKPVGNPRYSYSNLTSDVIFNYLMQRTGPNFDKFMSDFYQKKVKIQYPVHHMMNRLADGQYKASTKERTQQGAGRYDLWATRYDYLRIAKAMMDDWQANTCEGKYLKELYDRRVRLNQKQGNWQPESTLWGKPEFTQTASKYGGQFYTDFNGLNGKKVLLMAGFNGQQIVMDMDNSRIVVILAAMAQNYDTKKLGYEPIKYGRIR